MRWQPFRLALAALTTFLVLGYIIYPLGRLLAVGLSTPAAGAALLHRQVLQAAINSVLLALGSVAGSAVAGTGLAYALRYGRIRGRSFWATVLLLPLALPPLVGAMAFLFLLGDNGLVLRLLPRSYSDFSGWWAMLLLHWYGFYPLFLLFAGNRMRSLDDRVLEAAYALGARPGRLFWGVVLPQLRPALLSAALLTFMASMASFSAPFLFGGSRRFLTTEIYYAKVNGESERAALLAALLAAVSVAVLFGFRRYSRQLPPASKGTASTGAFQPGSGRGYLATALVAGFGGLVVLPVASLVLLSLTPNSVLMRPELRWVFSFQNYRTFATEGDFFQPFMMSLATAALAVLGTVALGLAVGHLGRGRRHWLKSALDVTASLPYGIPGTVVAIGLILSFSQPTVFALGQVLVGTVWILPVAYVVRNLPVLTQAVRVGLQSLDPALEEAAGSLGAGAGRVWRSITWPLLRPAVAEGALLVFINAFGEFVATVLLYTYATKTMPIAVYAQIRLFDNGMAATYGVVLFGVVLAVVAVTRWLGLPPRKQKIT